MTGGEYSIVQDTLSAFHSAMAQNNLTYIMAAGTMLGSYRHHGIIPWDDDVHVHILNEEKHRVSRALQALSPRYLMRYTRLRWKLFANVSQPIEGRSWRYPFVDISILIDFGDKRVDAYALLDLYLSPEWIFPLRLRPFGRLMLWAPKNTQRVLEEYYNDVGECVSTDYNHREEHPMTTGHTIKVACASLKEVYPMVERKAVVGGTFETIRKGNDLISWHFEADTD
eukprot:GHVO01020205.1.p1 GENE.GHVO01020205.1~~GHVO01020205.1.p1  ORF type:complete len:226 (-),score=6.97 GHVO01020205.1:1128-1805(-)